MLVAVAALAALSPGAAAVPSAASVVTRVVDGDTIALSGGTTVRLVQIDAPEAGTGECYSRAAARELRRLLPVGASVGLQADARLGRVDRYGRLLRYVWVGRLNVNVALVRRGAASVWFYGGVRGRHAGQLLYAAGLARRERRGLWGACETAWNPYDAVRANHKGSARPAAPGRLAVRGRCDPAYPTVCIPSPPPDLDCRDVPYRRFKVIAPDPHLFDGEGDGLGCEGSRR